MHAQTLDYHKLRYFWISARQGSLASAAKAIGVAQSTVSTQVQALEQQLDGLLFERGRRSLELTDLGKVAFRHADQIFEIGAELERAVASGAADTPTELIVGVADGVPKLVIRSLLAPVIEAAQGARLECREWRTDILLGELAQHRMDLVIADIAGTGTLPSRLLSYEAGASGIVLLAAPELASRARHRFPRELSGLPFLLPVRESPLRRALEVWFDANQILPRVVAEIDDRALLNQLGQAGMGVFPAALMLERELCRQFQVSRVGVLKGVRERYFVVTTRRRLRHAGVTLICDHARRQFTAASDQSRSRL